MKFETLHLTVVSILFLIYWIIMIVLLISDMRSDTMEKRILEEAH